MVPFTEPCAFQIISSEDHRKFAIKIGTALLKTFVALWENGKISWPTRVALAQCVREFLNLEEEDGEDFSEVFLKLLQVRRDWSRPLLFPPNFSTHSSCPAQHRHKGPELSSAQVHEPGDHPVLLALPAPSPNIQRLVAPAAAYQCVCPPPQRHKGRGSSSRRSLIFSTLFFSPCACVFTGKYHSEEGRVTALLTLGEIACVSPDNEQRILFELCVISGSGAEEKKPAPKAAATTKSSRKGKEKKRDGDDEEDEIEDDDEGGRDEAEEMSDLVAYIIEHIALTLSYPSSQSLLSDHLPFLLGRWCEAKFPLHLFPIHLLNEASLKDFLSHFAAILLPKLVYLTDRDNLELVAQQLAVTPEKLGMLSCAVCVSGVCVCVSVKHTA